MFNPAKFPANVETQLNSLPSQTVNCLNMFVGSDRYFSEFSPEAHAALPDSHSTAAISVPTKS